MQRLSFFASAIVGGLAVLAFGAAQALEDEAAKKKTADQAATFEYPGANRLVKNNLGSIYQGLFTTKDALEKVAVWYDKKLVHPGRNGIP